MLAKVYSGALMGVDAYKLDIEVDTSQGLPGIVVVGLPDAVVQEARERIRLAIKNSGHKVTASRIIVNMAPADTKKEGSAFDLPIAMGILQATRQLDAQDELADYLIIGELTLEGAVRKVKGVLSLTFLAKQLGKKGIIVPKDNINEASLVSDIEIYPVSNLLEVIEHFKGINKLKPHVSEKVLKTHNPHHHDLSDVKGHSAVKRALQIAATGAHNVLMVGPPGSGKTMLAKRFIGLLPPLNEDEMIEVVKIYSAAGLSHHLDSILSLNKPFRHPHHSISTAGLVGGTSMPKPGEISLAHRGVLFLDELPEFKKEVLELLRQPLEDGSITISRAKMALSYPANFIFITAMNPCPCGFYGDRLQECKCTQSSIQKYWSKLSGPLLDRIDIQIEVPRLNEKELQGDEKRLSNAELLDGIQAGINKQRERLSKNSENFDYNANLTPAQTQKYCVLDSEAQKFMSKSVEKLKLSARSYDRILRIARTIADMAGSDSIQIPHIAEAINYRSIDRYLE